MTIKRLEITEELLRNVHPSAREMFLEDELIRAGFDPNKQILRWDTPRAIYYEQEE